MIEMERKSNKLILLMLLLPLAVVIVAAGCQKKDKGLYNFVVTSETTSDASTEETSVMSVTETAETTETTETSETTTEETEEITDPSEETTTKAEVKAGSKQAPTQTTAKKTVKPTSKPKTAKKTAKKTKKTTKATKKATPTPKPKYTSYLFVGDSRTVGLDEAVSGVSSIAKVGAGVSYFKSIVPDVIKVRGKNVIFNFGVNDLDRYKDYITVYKSLPKEFIQKNNVIFMSVNPTDGSKYKSWNTDIDKFNAYIKKNLPSGIKYLNTNATLKKEGFQTRDGCHYKPVTYKRIAQLTFIFCGDKNKKP